MKLYVFLIMCLCTVRVYSQHVFAHFMVSNAYHWDQSDWEYDINLAVEAHIDAFALNIAYSGDNSGLINNLTIAFEAVQYYNFNLFFSFDYPGGTAFWPAEDVETILGTFIKNPKYLTYNGQPFVSTFEGWQNAADWVGIKSATNCFFIPDWSSLGAAPALAYGVADGLFNWAAWPTGPMDTNTYIDASYVEDLGEMPYMIAISPWFYTNLPGFDKNWLWRGDDMWYQRWQQVIYLAQQAKGPTFIEIITWNDYGESHYIGPRTGDFSLFGPDSGNAPYDYASGMPHDGWRNTLPFWIDLYNTGTATVTEESITAWYRLSPVNATATCPTGNTTGNTASQLQYEFQPGAILQDKIFYSAVLGSAATVYVFVGETQLDATWTYTPFDGVGVYHGSVEYGDALGQVVVVLERGSTKVEILGSTISTDCGGYGANYNAWVDTASFGTIAAISPSLNTADQVCIAGFGTYNFDGLCEFTCHYDYCPVGACVCTEMGIAVTRTTPLNETGYPLVGETQSYEGLCAFACDYENGCIPSACSYAVNTDWAVLDYSEFLPLACTSGETLSDINFTGLCSYSCGYGYCPIELCVCSGTGPLVEAPAITSDKGYASDATADIRVQDICNFACLRGYCPSPVCTYINPADPDQSGEIVYINPDIWSSTTPIVTALPGVTLVWPPMPLDSPTTITFPLLTTTVLYSSLTTLTSTLTDGSTSTYPWYVYVIFPTVVTIPAVTTTAIPVWGVTLGTSSTGGFIYLTSSIQPDPFIVTVTPVIGGTTNIVGATTTTQPGTTVVWAGIYTYVEPQETETVGGSTTIIGGTTLAPTGVTITPNPYPTTVPSTKDSTLNSKTASWSSATPFYPTSLPGCIGCGLPCFLFCDPDCPFCPPGFFGSGDSGDGDGTSTGTESQSSTTTAFPATILFATDTPDEFPFTYADPAALSSQYVAEESIWDSIFSITTAAASTTTAPPVSTPTTTTVTPTASASCAFWDQLVGYGFEIYNIVGWVTDGGSSLETQEEGCGAVTSWNWVAATDTTEAYVHFYLPFFIAAGCVERAIVSAGGPQISCVGEGLPVKRSLKARTPARAGPMFLPMTEEQREIALSVYGNTTYGIPHNYTPMDWSVTNSSTTAS